MLFLGICIDLVFWWSNPCNFDLRWLHSRRQKESPWFNVGVIFVLFWQQLQEIVSLHMLEWTLSRKGSQRVGRTFLPRGWGPKGRNEERCSSSWIFWANNTSWWGKSIPISAQRKLWGSVVSLKATPMFHHLVSDSEICLVYWKMLLPKWLRKSMTKNESPVLLTWLWDFCSPVPHWTCSTFSFPKKVCALVVLLFVFQMIFYFVLW